MDTLDIGKEKRLVPVLRFKEFEGDWEIISMRDLLLKLIDCEHKTAPYVDESDYLVIRTNNVKGGQLIYADIKYTTKEGFKEWTKRSVPEFGDILFSREAPAGESCLVPKNKQVCLGQRMVLLKPNEEKMTGQYLSCYLQSGKAIRSISNLSIGTTVTRINIADIYKLKCPTTGGGEQKKIATFLSTIDKKIQQLTRKKALLEAYKKGLMQQLFSGVLRFKDEEGKDYPAWEEKRLGEIAVIITGSTPPTSNKLFYDGDYQFVSPADIGESRFVFSTIKTVTKSGFKKGRKIKSESTLFVCIGSTIGKIAQSDKDCITNQQINALEAKDGFDNSFIYYLLFKEGQKIKLLAGVQAVPQINKTDFSKLKYYIPSHPEQQKIANYLSSIDKKIETITTQITKTQTFKKGLLQQMFV